MLRLCKVIHSDVCLLCSVFVVCTVFIFTIVNNLSSKIRVSMFVYVHTRKCVCKKSGHGDDVNDTN